MFASNHPRVDRHALPAPPVHRVAISSVFRLHCERARSECVPSDVTAYWTCSPSTIPVVRASPSNRATASRRLDSSGVAQTVSASRITFQIAHRRGERHSVARRHDLAVFRVLLRRCVRTSAELFTRRSPILSWRCASPGQIFVRPSVSKSQRTSFPMPLCFRRPSWHWFFVA